jgi:hypothetical protein
MIDHLDAMNRLAEARVREALNEGRPRPTRFHLTPAIMGTVAHTRAAQPNQPLQAAGRPLRARSTSQANWLRWPRAWTRRPT